jgi:hypothetical protein
MIEFSSSSLACLLNFSLLFLYGSFLRFYRRERLSE